MYPQEKRTTDTTNTYYDDLTDLLSLRLFTLTKLNTLEIANNPNGRLVFRPNGNTSLGFGFNYKFVGLALSFGLPRSPSSIAKYGQTDILDVQVSSFGRRIGFDCFLQGYRGYYMANPGDHMDWNESYFPQSRDLQILSFGAQAFYMFNSEEFSYKAAYQRTMVQKRSAGSFSSGIYFYQDKVTSDNGFVPREITDSVWADFDLKEFSAFSIGVTAGYQYTFVIKGNFFISLQGTPGVGLRRFSGSTVSDDLGIVDQLAGQFLAKAALGYEFKHFYVGATASMILRSFKYRNYLVDLGTEQFRVMIGKRFDVSRK